MLHAVVLLSKKIPFDLLSLLPSFAQTFQVATHFYYDLSYCHFRSDSSPDFVLIA
jgi:hypothetical protein